MFYQLILVINFWWWRQKFNPWHIWLDHFFQLSDLFLDFFDRLIERNFFGLHYLLFLFREVEFRVDDAVKLGQLILQLDVIFELASEFILEIIQFQALNFLDSCLGLVLNLSNFELKSLDEIINLFYIWSV